MEFEQQALTTETTAVVARARAFAVATNDEYQEAGAFLTDIKRAVKKVTEFFADSKAKAAAAHKAVCDNEKALLDPLKLAEGALKGTMAAYNMKVEQERIEAEVEAWRRQQEEADRLAQQAVDAEEKGDVFGAQMAMAQASMVEDMKPVQTVQAPKAAGVSMRYKWVADVLDEKAVPAYANGICIRIIDTAALANLARMSNGQIEIPGIRFRQEPIISARV